MNNNKTRDSFNSKIGFILACIGSAVGMGNIWLFPYRVGQFGGAAFLIPYFIFVLLIGFTGVIGEMAFGRSMRNGPLGAFKKAFEKKGLKGGGILGLIPTLAALALGIGYAVVVGWILRFTVGSITGSMLSAENSAAYFGEIAGNYSSISWHILGLVIVFSIMIFGIGKGIEKINKVLMPLFFVLFIFLAIRVFMLGGDVSKGYEYLFNTNWEALSDKKTWIYALGQAFFSLSLAGCGTVVYGSYLDDKEDLVSSAFYVSIFDTIAALLAALVIIPAVFAFGIEPTAGPALMFISLPEVFKTMPAGSIFAIIFFVAVLFAGITSLINIFESPVEALQSKFGLSRHKSIAIIAVIAFAVGVFIEGDHLSGWMDFVSIYALPLGALLAGFTFFWILGFPFAEDEVSKGRDHKIGAWFRVFGKYVFCGITVLVYILGLIYGGIG